MQSIYKTSIFKDMKKKLLLIACVLLPLLASAQTVQSGITPFIFHQAWEKVVGDNTAAAETMLKKVGYSKVGYYTPEIGFNIVYAKGCTVTVSRSGKVKSAKATANNAYASYVQIGAGTGLCYDMSVTFLSQKGAQAFISLLKKSGYRFARRDLYDWGIIENVWERPSDHWRVMQKGNTFYIDEGPCA